MISALTVKHIKIIEEDGTNDRWMVLSTCTNPSTELINMETGEVCHFGDMGQTAARFTETDENLHEDDRSKAFELMHSRRKGELVVDACSINLDDYTKNNTPGAVLYQKPMASVHKLRVVQNANVLDDVKGVSDDPAREYLDMIAEELINLTDLCVKGKLRGIAISYVIIDEEERITGNHNFITDGRGIVNLNAGIDLVKDYIVEAMRERFRVNKGE